MIKTNEKFAIRNSRIESVLNIIHLSHRTDRWDLVFQQIDNQKISKYFIWQGIRNQNAPWTGISQAHKQIIQFARDRNMPYVLVAEDDVKFTASGAFDYFLANIPEDFDLYLGGIMHGKVKPDHTVDDFSGAMLYVIHQRFFDTFLSISEDQHIDRGLAGKGRFVVCQPMVVTQHDGFSDNVKRMVIYKPYVENYEFYNGKP